MVVGLVLVSPSEGQTVRPIGPQALTTASYGVVLLHADAYHTSSSQGERVPNFNAWG